MGIPKPEPGLVVQFSYLTSTLNNFFFNLLKNLFCVIASRRRRRGNQVKTAIIFLTGLPRCARSDDVDVL
ncbi:MAG: hypothetical protein WCJ33_07530 [Pseudomonadota bacterium]